jgi:hypothetical protein
MLSHKECRRHAKQAKQESKAPSKKLFHNRMGAYQGTGKSQSSPEPGAEVELEFCRHGRPGAIKSGVYWHIHEPQQAGFEPYRLLYVPFRQ